MEETSKLIAAIWKCRNDRTCHYNYFQCTCLDVLGTIVRMVLGKHEVLGALPTGLWLHENCPGGVHLLGIDRTLGDAMMDAAQSTSGTYRLTKKYVWRHSVYGNGIMYHPCPDEDANLCSGLNMYVVQRVGNKFRLTLCREKKVKAKTITIPVSLRDRDPKLRIISSTSREPYGVPGAAPRPIYVIQCGRDVHLWIYSRFGGPTSELRRVCLAVDEGVSWNGINTVIWNSVGQVRNL